MKVIYSFVILCCCIPVWGNSPVSLFDQLLDINPYWTSNVYEEELSAIASLEVDREALIQLHLLLVEEQLHSKPINELSQDQAKKRKQSLSVLRSYWQTGVFPQNTDHSYSIPYFVDENNTACAVGHLMRAAGSNALVSKIAAEMNNAYIKEMDEVALTAWADEHGFTVAELKWIQPSYGPPLFVMESIENPNCGASNGSVSLTVEPSDWGAQAGAPESIENLVYQWYEGINVSESVSSTVSEFEDYPAGRYTCNMVDVAANFKFESHHTLSDLEMPEVSVTITQESSLGTLDGSIAAFVEGFGDYSYEWSTYDGTIISTDSELLGLAAYPGGGFNGPNEGNQVFLRIEDQEGCRHYSHYEISDVLQCVVVYTATNSVQSADCDVANGSIFPYYSSNDLTFQWSDGSTAANLENVPSGTYTLTATDNTTNCSTTRSFFVPENCNSIDECIDESLIDPEALCPLVIAPVCGCDGVTYNNSCLAEVQGGVVSWTDGECTNDPDCIDEELIGWGFDCFSQPWEFVCGCDGVTYANPCDAVSTGGVLTYTDGPCASSECSENWEDNFWLQNYVPENDCGCISSIEVYLYEGQYMFYIQSQCDASDFFHNRYVDCNGLPLCTTDISDFTGGPQCLPSFYESIEFVAVAFECPSQNPCAEDVIFETSYVECFGTEDIPQSEAQENWCFSVDVTVTSISWFINGQSQNSFGDEFCAWFNTLEAETAEVCAYFDQGWCQTEYCTEVAFTQECNNGELGISCSDASYLINDDETISFSILEHITTSIEGPFISTLLTEPDFGTVDLTPSGDFNYEAAPGIYGAFPLVYEVCTEDFAFCCSGIINIEVATLQDCGEINDNPWLLANTPGDEEDCECVERIDVFKYQGDHIFFLDSQCNFIDESDYFVDCEGVFICATIGFLPPEEFCTEAFLNEVEFVETHFQCEQFDPCLEGIEINSEYVECIGTDDIPQSESSEFWCFSVPEISGQTNWSVDGVVVEIGSETCFWIDALSGINPEVCVQVFAENCTVEECAEYVLTGDCTSQFQPSLTCADLSLEVEGMASVSANLFELIESNSNEEIVITIDENSNFGEIVYGADGVFIFTAFSNGNGVQNVNYQACLQNSGVCCDGIISITVSPEDGAIGPELAEDFYWVDANELVICPLENDTFEAEAFTFSWESEDENFILTEQDNNCFLVEFNSGNTDLVYTGTYTVCLPNNSCSTSSFSLQLSTGINDLNLEVNVYPNPVSTEIFIESSKEYLEQLRVFDVSGRMLKEQSLSGYSGTVNLSDLSTGIYLLVIKGEISNRVERIVVE